MQHRIVRHRAAFGRSGALALCVALCAVGLSGSASAKAKYATFAIKDAIQTTGGSINDNGYIAGWTMDSSQRNHGILRAPDGTITIFNVSGATDTFGSSINSKNVITGIWFAYYEPGYVRAADGTITPFDPPGATMTEPVCINDKGVIVGTWADQSGTFHGFLRSAHGKFTSFD